MAKFIFRLQGIFNTKQKIEDLKKQEFGLAAAEVEREKQKKQELLNKKEETIIEFRHRIDEILNSPGHENYNNYIEYLKKEVVRQDKVILEAEIKLEQKRNELVDAMKERKTLEKLRERQYEEFMLEQKLVEQRVVDEVVSFRIPVKGG